MKGISLILGNDLAGSKVVANPQVLEIPCKEAKWEQEKQCEGLFPSCAVTCTMAKAIQNEANTGKDDEPGDDMLTSTESTGELQDSFSQSAETDTTRISMESQAVGESRQSVENVILSPQKLIVYQEKDQEIWKLKHRALNER